MTIEEFNEKLYELFPEAKEGKRIDYEKWKEHDFEIYDLIYNQITSIIEKEVK